MTWFSLKRTLQSDLASKIDVLCRSHLGSNLLNFHTLVRYSGVLLSIGKITKICHQSIPVKKVPCGEMVTYFSVIPLKVAGALQLPVDDVASVLLSLLENQGSQSIWSSVRKTDQGCLEFVIAHRGIQQWQYQLHHNSLAPLIQGTPPLISDQPLWQLQSGYELCCRWLAGHPIFDGEPDQHAGHPFVISVFALESLVDALLDICDVWDDATPTQLLSKARQLVLTLDRCICVTGPSSLDAVVVSPWIKTTQIVLKHLLSECWGYPLAEKF